MAGSSRLSWAAAIGAFTTIVLAGMPAAGAATVTVATAGDIARTTTTFGDPQSRTADLIGDIAPAKVIVLGDEQYEHGEYANFLASYGPTWGAYDSIAAPVPGNHEYETANASGYFQYFAGVLAQYGTTATDPQKGYYSFDIGDWHVVGLNTQCSAPGLSCSAERTWLRQNLEADNHLCEIIFSHHASKQNFANTAASLGVELWLAGHRHAYERWDRKFDLDLRQLVVGTGGKSLGSPSTNADAGVRGYGVAKLTLDAAGYSWQFIDIDARVRDSGSDTCSS